MSTPSRARPRCIVVMGISGVGKTTVGRLLARRLGWKFFDADDYHPPANVAKMRDGIPLTDEDREEWLDRLRVLINTHLETGMSAVLACSALKRTYRRKLRNGHDGMIFVYLRAPRNVVETRLDDRKDHFFNPELLESQYAVLEEPLDAIIVDATVPVFEIVEAVVSAMPH